jgi:hypothetical protein
MSRGMTTKRRLALTVAAGLVLGLDTWVAEQPGSPTPGVNDLLAVPLLIVALVSLILVPLIVGRWWVVCAVAGPALSLLIMQLTGAAVGLDDGTGPAINYRTIFLLIVVGLVMLLVVGLRFLFDDVRRSRADARREWRETLSRGPGDTAAQAEPMPRNGTNRPEYFPE